MKPWATSGKGLTDTEDGATLMRYKLLGRSGLRVSEFCLGTMTFGDAWGWGADDEESRKLFHLYLDKGGNFIDTAVNYTDGQSETLIGRFIKGLRQELVIATKYSLTHPQSTDPNSGGNSRKSLVQSLERSLKRLKTDYVDLLYLHMWDYLTPVEEVLRGMDDLVSAGKVLYLAVSDSPAWIVAEANARAELRGWSQFVGLQVPYSLLDRSVERSLLPVAQHWGMTVLPWGLLEGGLLAEKSHSATDQTPRLDPSQVHFNQRQAKTLEEVKVVAGELRRPVAQVAINWVRQQTHRAQIIPVIGARTTDQLEKNLGALAWRLPDDCLERLNEVSKLNAGFPQSLIPANRYLFGATFDEIDAGQH
jgi:aryl-alcohol dehydrogenase-like predicted oxidoreductase